MKPEINIIPLPNFLKKEEGEYKLTSTSEVSLIIENSTAASMLKNQQNSPVLTNKFVDNSIKPGLRFIVSTVLVQNTTKK